MAKETEGRELAGKVALVTGASRGIGRAIAKALAADGALVAVHFGGSADAAHKTVAEIEAAGGKSFAVQADLASAEGPAALFRAVDEEVQGRTGSNAIDIVVNNAGVGPYGGFGVLDAQAFEQLYAVNIRAVYLVTELAAQRLRDGGRVINVSSAITRVGIPDLLAYAATKGWVNSFTWSAAAALGERGITVNAVAPGVIRTDMAGPLLAGGEAGVTGNQVLKRIGEPEDVARLVRALAGPAGGWTTGQVIDVSGGTLIAI
jgi:NAD(P)-dependent dehydrogenase (short-subunit alcohol dehydrogenase family)